MIHFATGPKVYLRNAVDLERFEVGAEYRVYRHCRPISAATVKVVDLHPTTAALIVEDPAGLWAEMRRGDELRNVR